VFKALLCTSIAAESVEAMFDKVSMAFAQGSDLVELRLDTLRKPSVTTITHLFRDSMDRIIVALRPKFEGGKFAGPEKRRVEMLFELSQETKPYLFDVELRTLMDNTQLRKSIDKSKLIISWHNMELTPSHSTLTYIAKKAADMGYFAKIVTRARSTEDNIRVLSLYRQKFANRLIAFCMGDLGVPSRFVSILLGNPIIYCSLPYEPVAEGQVPLPIMHKMMELVDY